MLFEESLSVFKRGDSESWMEESILKELKDSTDPLLDVSSPGLRVPVLLCFFSDLLAEYWRGPRS